MNTEQLVDKTKEIDSKPESEQKEECFNAVIEAVEEQANTYEQAGLTQISAWLQ